MIVYFENMTAPYIVVMDVEHDQGKLLQYAGVLFQRVGDSLYQISKSINFYIKRDAVSNFTAYFTHITEKFLQQYGITEEEAVEQFNQFLEDIPHEDIIFVSHGIHQDSMVMQESGLNIEDSPHLCTHRLARTVLCRDKKLKLSDILAEAGLCTVLEHNAYTDALETAWVLSFLLKNGGSKSYGKIYKY